MHGGGLEYRRRWQSKAVVGQTSVVIAIAFGACVCCLWLCQRLQPARSVLRGIRRVDRVLEHQVAGSQAGPIIHNALDMNAR